MPWIEDPAAIHRMAADAAVMVRAGRSVVVNCAAGLNRSGLLVARSLIELGRPPKEAVELVREARGVHALSNKQFVRFLFIDCTPRALAARERRG
ncbi:MAG: dual specificity protein phosphatase family protein [Actinobacteria bacterium]|nr:dual specificity protein phosphatase family protein [Actinomycetota bacterium]